MTKAVLTTKIDPTYDDLPEQRYHFPRSYLRQVEAAKGDWIVYYEPRRSSGNLSSRGGRQAYFATARVTEIVADPTLADHFYAYIADYLDFDRAVPFREGVHYYESALRRDDGETSKGAFGRAVRPLGDAEYDEILRAGFAHVLAETTAPANGVGLDLAEEPATFERPIIERVVRRPFREAAFAGAVKTAYGDTCAMTGIKIVNGGGRTEVQAAHIRPVVESGPDSLRNGIALCGTLHWMFDRGLVSIADDHTLLLAKGKVPEPVSRMINPDRQLLRPDRPDHLPHPQFLRWHRENRFKG
jgi:putative restriction endonuclease